jgi:tetratricopeptide (TPR) repeat protein
VQTRRHVKGTLVILRISSNAQRAAVLVIALSLALPMIYFATRSSLAVHARNEGTLSGYERATHLAPADPENWLSLGNYWLNEAQIPDFGLAIRAYRKGLAVNPRSYEMWLNIAMAYEAENQLPESREALDAAELAYPSSPDVEWRYGNFLLRREEIPEGLNKLRRSVDIDPARAAEAFSISSKVLPDKDINYVLSAAISQSADAYLSILDDLVAKQQLDDALIVWSLIHKIGSKLPLPTTTTLVYSLQRAGRASDAKRVWVQASDLAQLDLPQSLPGSLVWDGSFESRFKNGGYAWNYQEQANGVRILLDPIQKHSGSFSLRVSFDGTSDLTYHDVCQRIPVEGLGSYEFSAWIRTEALTTDQGVRFSFSAIDVPQKNEAVTADFQGTMPWTRVESRWIAPRDAKQMEICLLRYPSDQADNRIRGTVWIDDVAFVPTPSTSGAK